MKVQVLMLLATLTAAIAHEYLLDGDDRSPPSEDDDWKRFKSKHKKKYKNKNREKIRKNTFLRRNRGIKQHNNQAGVLYKLEVNQFADWTDDELLQLKSEIDTENEIPGPVVGEEILRQLPVPDEVDLRDSSCMSPVKFQGGCGSCYSFASTNPLEYQRCMKTGKLVVLSEENIVDCSQKYGNAGCNGGLALRSWNYIKDVGISTEDDYPYQGEETLCEYTSNYYSTNVTNWAYATRTRDEEAMKAVVANYGPLAVSVDASDWEFYSSGVLSLPTCSNTSTNHAVVIVGYGTESVSKKPYWIIRNSWGTEWGLAGYVFLERGVNMCAVAKRAVFPTVYN